VIGTKILRRIGVAPSTFYIASAQRKASEAGCHERLSERQRLSAGVVHRLENLVRFFILASLIKNPVQ
jgi:hypothetical protein